MFGPRANAASHDAATQCPGKVPNRTGIRSSLATSRDVRRARLRREKASHIIPSHKGFLTLQSLRAWPALTRLARLLFSQSDARRTHVQEVSRDLFQRHLHRSRHGEYADLRAWPGHRAERALGGRHPPGSRPGRPAHRGCRWWRRQAHAGPYPGQHRHRAADEGRRDRRLHHDRGDAAALHQAGAQVAHAAPQPARAGLRAVRLDPGRAPCDQGVGRGRRRPRRVPDRGADGRGDRRRHSRARGARLDGAGYRRRHLRGRGDLAQRHRLLAVGARRWRPLRRGDHQLRAPQPRHPDRRIHRRAHQAARSAAPSRRAK